MNSIDQTTNILSTQATKSILKQIREKKLQQTLLNKMHKHKQQKLLGYKHKQLKKFIKPQ